MSRQKEIDCENNVLLGKIIQIMKRKNRSLIDAKYALKNNGLNSKMIGMNTFFNQKSQRDTINDIIVNHKNQSNSQSQDTLSHPNIS